MTTVTPALECETEAMQSAIVTGIASIGGGSHYRERGDERQVGRNAATRDPDHPVAALHDALPAAGVAFWANGEGYVIAAADPAQLSSPTLWRRLEAVKHGDGGMGPPRV
ncbi:hypothetical protein [Paraburkholderia lacunae]|uniref:Uncharacterized protein n=1 Tax=Paraburkholderia lacunae TaxID=2211104 RepID=A0A370NAM4_9BURK|nr:hypothetical protein [Paraburkholderia lacunae]RDK02661.1 hypothetical protein DLM46_10385 [Paraburkholderia lacunae]